MDQRRLTFLAAPVVVIAGTIVFWELFCRALSIPPFILRQASLDKLGTFPLWQTLDSSRNHQRN